MLAVVQLGLLLLREGVVQHVVARRGLLALLQLLDLGHDQVVGLVLERLIEFRDLALLRSFDRCDDAPAVAPTPTSVRLRTCVLRNRATS